MAVRISNTYGSYDRFKVKCPICGSELEYTRRDVRAHARWKNGFIYCPKCRNPVGHDEANLIEKGQDRLTSLYGESEEKYAKDIEVLKILRTIFIPVGIVLLVISFVLALLFELNPMESYAYLIILSFLLFPIGLGMLIASGVFTNAIRNRQAAITLNSKRRIK